MLWNISAPVRGYDMALFKYSWNTSVHGMIAAADPYQRTVLTFMIYNDLIKAHFLIRI